jgi:organic hydroperoxide reductase OsmC/OhrA
MARIRKHTYTTTVTWTGNRGTGTSGYRDYDRTTDIEAPGRPVLPSSSDPLFRGDPARWNPELLLVAALSQCHLLWYLHLCSDAGVVVESYVDEPVGVLAEEVGGPGRFTEVVLRPRIVVAAPDMVDRARQLHARAHELCYIAQSVNFPVRHEPTVSAAGG